MGLAGTPTISPAIQSVQDVTSYIGNQYVHDEMEAEDDEEEDEDPPPTGGEIHAQRLKVWFLLQSPAPYNLQPGAEHGTSYLPNEFIFERTIELRS